jgi:hypothetical protein
VIRLFRKECITRNFNILCKKVEYYAYQELQHSEDTASPNRQGEEERKNKK